MDGLYFLPLVYVGLNIRKSFIKNLGYVERDWITTYSLRGMFGWGICMIRVGEWERVCWAVGGTCIQEWDKDAAGIKEYAAEYRIQQAGWYLTGNHVFLFVRVEAERCGSFPNNLTMWVNASWGVMIVQAWKDAPGRLLCGRGVFLKDVSRDLLAPLGAMPKKTEKNTHTHTSHTHTATPLANI